MDTKYNLQNVAIVLAKILMLFKDRTKWLKFNYSRTDYNNAVSCCLVEAIAKFAINGANRIITREYLTVALMEYVREKRLTINTGNYPLNLATFNDNVPYELMMAFIKNTYDNLVYKLDNDLI